MAQKPERQWSDPSARTGVGAYLRALTSLRKRNQRPSAAAMREQALADQERELHENWAAMDAELQRIKDEHARESESD